MTDYSFERTVSEVEFPDGEFISEMEISYDIDVEQVDGDDYFGPEIVNLTITGARLGGLTITTAQLVQMIGMGPVVKLTADSYERAYEQIKEV